VNAVPEHFSAMNAVLLKAAQNSETACRETLRNLASEGVYWELMGGRPDLETTTSTLRNLRWSIGTNPLVRRPTHFGDRPIVAHAYYDLCVLRALSPVWNPKPSESETLETLIRDAEAELPLHSELDRVLDAYLNVYQLPAETVSHRMSSLVQPEEGVPIGEMPYILMSGVACAHVESERATPSLLRVLSYGLHARVQLLVTNNSERPMPNHQVMSLISGWCTMVSLSARPADGAEADRAHLDVTVRHYLAAAGLTALSRLDLVERNRTMLRNGQSR